MRLLIALVALSVLAPAASATPLYGIDYGPHAHGRLLVRDPLTLRPRGPILTVWSGFHWATAFSPDGKRLAISHERHGRLTIVDLSARTNPIHAQRTAMPLAHMTWTRGAILGVTCCTSPNAAVEVDPDSARTVKRSLRGQVGAVAMHPGGLVALMAPSEGVGQARLAVVAPGAAVRFLPVPGVRAGSSTPPRDPQATWDPSYHPGVATDGTTAWVVSSEGHRIVAVDLATGAATTHDVAPLAGAAKFGENHYRAVVDLGGGRLVFYGDEESASGRVDPIGAWLVDTRTWTSRLLVHGPRQAMWSAGTLLTVDYEGRELRAFDRDGRSLWHRRGRMNAVEVAGSRAYVRNAARRGKDHRTYVIDVRTGRLRSTLRTSTNAHLLVP